MTASSWDHARRILCVRLDYLGDVLMSTPAMRALKHSLPGRHVTLLTSSGGAAVAPYIPEIDETIVYGAPWLKNSDRHSASDDLAMIDRLREGRFDAAVIFTVYSQNPLPSAMLCYLACIPLRLAHCRENPYQLLTHWIPETEPHERVRHEVRRQLDLVALVGARTMDERLSFTVPSADAAQVQRILRELDIDPERPWLAMHPGATAAARRYPPQQWAQAARELATTIGCPLIFTGSKEEAALVDQVRHGIPNAHSLAGKLSLGQLAALIAQASVLVSNNTGPAHLAAAVGTPVVDLYALTNPQHIPWQVESRVLFHDVPCRYCYKSICPQGHHRCLTGVPPQQVAGAVRELLDTRMRCGSPDRKAACATGSVLPPVAGARPT